MRLLADVFKFNDISGLMVLVLLFITIIRGHFVVQHHAFGLCLRVHGTVHVQDNYKFWMSFNAILPG